VEQSRKPRWLIKLVSVAVLSGLLLSYAGTVVSPEKTVLLYFFTLSYPFWLAANLFFAGMWLIRRRAFGYIHLLAVLAGWSFVSTFVRILPGGNEEKGSGGMKLGVMSYNVRLFDLYNWSENTRTRDLIFEQLRSSEAGVYCFQEFYYTSRKGIFETRDTLLRLLKTPYIHEKYTHKMTGEQYFGVVTLSKYPIVNKGELAFDNDQNNFCIFSDIAVEEDTIRVFNAHLASIRLQREDYRFMESGGEGSDRLEGSRRIAGRLRDAAKKRARQSDEIAEAIKNSPYPVVLCGDFNDTPVSYTYGRLSEGLEDSFVARGMGTGGTYIGKIPSFRIDYILHSDDIQTLRFKTYNEKLSDHRAIEAMLSIEGK
jgi:endonuclease/exonuclease/phosphatase family metal-dependent hydrolase